MERKHSLFAKKYFYLLISLIIYLLMHAILSTHKIDIYIFDILFLITIILCIYSVANKLIVICFTAALGTISIITNWMLNATVNSLAKETILTHHFSNILFMGLVTCCILVAIAQKKRVTMETLFGAICGYFLIGLTWASIYQIITTLNPQSFSILNPNMSSHSILMESPRAQAQYFIYFSYVTLTTVGYGDILAVSNIAKTFSWLEAITGQIFLVVWISQLVSLYVIEKQKEDDKQSSR